ncbi:hypothetical protein AN958_03650 [Leucoagaricus sp. SymC.cos]|nr:hypothetical protein AN958_03650 [Leucoagaricus sp. SymC.cos]
MPAPNLRSVSRLLSLSISRLVHNDVEAQSQSSDTQEDPNPYSPYFSPLEDRRKKIGLLFQNWEQAEMYACKWIDLWGERRKTWSGWATTRRSSL